MEKNKEITMKQLFAAMMVALIGASFTGCARVQTKVVEKPRVDQQLQGNRGYLKGSAPADGDRRKTREMLETNVELPTLAEMMPWRKRPSEAEQAAAAQAPVAPPVPAYEYEPEPSRQWEPEPELDIEPIRSEASSYDDDRGSVPAGGTSYTVQKGDTLQKIAKKFYGSSAKWYRIYKANKDVLKSPDHIKPGQELTIPALDDESAPAKPARSGGNDYK